MQEHFVGASLREKQNAKMRFEFPPQAKPLAEMFGFIEVSQEPLTTTAAVSTPPTCTQLLMCAAFAHPSTHLSIHPIYPLRSRNPIQPNPVQPNPLRSNPTQPIPIQPNPTQPHGIESDHNPAQNNRVALSVGEYSLSQTSLEQVFNAFAAQQEEELGHAAGTTSS